MSNQDAALIRTLQRRVADLSIENERITLLINTANEGALSMAHVHGWRCPDQYVAMGADYRRRIAELQRTIEAPNL